VQSLRQRKGQGGRLAFDIAMRWLLTNWAAAGRSMGTTSVQNPIARIDRYARPYLVPVLADQILPRPRRSV